MHKDPTHKFEETSEGKRSSRGEENRTPRALLMAEKPQSPSYLAKRLEEQGCSCRFATSYLEARSSLSSEEFDVVLSPVRLRGVTLFPLVDLLEGSRVTLFYSHAVEQGCWWLPALRRGEKCFGSAAFRPSEFASVLDQVIAQIRMDWHVIREMQQPVQSPLLVLEVPSRNEPASPTPVRAWSSELVKQTLLTRVAG